jgi:HD-GYP domain-containing protein (c-di-GMP phosphodiesterase class II)
MIILEATALLHDIGLLGVNERILLKPAPLTDKEREEIEKHVIRGYYLLWGFEELEDVGKYIGCHHERYNGSGYPNCLTGRRIPVIGRILAVTEAYDAMISPRPYRKAKLKKQVKEELKKFAGKQFDPEMVKHLLKALNSNRG